MPKLALSDASVRSLGVPPSGHLDYWDISFREGAFACRVAYSGTKTFIVKIDNSRQSVGRYPLISLADARAQAKRLIAERTLGKARPSLITYETALAEFLEEKRNSRRKITVHNLEDRINRHFAFKGYLKNITHRDVASRLSKLKTNSQYDHALSVARTFFNWAYDRRYIDDNPMRGLKLRGSPSRSRVLTDIELCDVWKAAEEMGGIFGAIVKLLILSGQRRGESSAIRTSCFDSTGKTITLAAEITKNRREHTFPVGELTVQILSSLPMNDDVPQSDRLYFPARGKFETPFNGWSKSKAELDKLIRSRCTKSGRENWAVVHPWTLHDLRRTVASKLAALGVGLPVIERLLNHVSGSFGGIVSVYQRHSFMPEMRAAVAKWEGELTRIVNATAS